MHCRTQGRLYHMHDAHVVTGKQNHLPLGIGNLDLQKYFTMAISQGCGVMLEINNCCAEAIY